MEFADKNDFGEGCHILNICVHLQNISTINVFNAKKNMGFFTSKGDAKGRKIGPFSHKRKVMSLISLYI